MPLGGVVGAAASKSWNPFDQPVDYILLAGKRSPGIATVEGADKMRKWDEIGGYGLSWARLIFNGMKLSHFSVKLRLYTRLDWLEWDAWKALVQKMPQRVFTADGPGVSAKSFGAHDIWHPLLEPLEIKAVVVENEPQPVMTDETGEWTIEIKFIAFRNPKPALAAPKAAVDKPVTDPVDRQILLKMDRLNQELAK